MKNKVCYTIRNYRVVIINFADISNPTGHVLQGIFKKIWDAGKVCAWECIKNINIESVVTVTVIKF